MWLAQIAGPQLDLEASRGESSGRRSLSREASPKYFGQQDLYTSPTYTSAKMQEVGQSIVAAMASAQFWDFGRLRSRTLRIIAAASRVETLF
jgi:hypothetical protein